MDYKNGEGGLVAYWWIVKNVSLLCLLKCLKIVSTGNFLLHLALKDVEMNAI